MTGKFCRGLCRNQLDMSRWSKNPKLPRDTPPPFVICHHLCLQLSQFVSATFTEFSKSQRNGIWALKI